MNEIMTITNEEIMPRVGYAFVPMQSFADVYLPEDALMRGTIFAELDIPMEKYGKQYEMEE